VSNTDENGLPRRPVRYTWGPDGLPRLVYDTEGMTSPYRCLRCGHVHDAGKVTPVGRYTDCTTWRCPGCGSLIDDRPRGWGGSAEPVEKSPERHPRRG
jgi:DNA-directed RNA polymerase subunit RPC12/RpoP